MTGCRIEDTANGDSYTAGPTRSPTADGDHVHRDAHAGLTAGDGPDPDPGSRHEHFNAAELATRLQTVDSVTAGHDADAANRFGLVDGHSAQSTDQRL